MQCANEISSVQQILRDCREIAWRVKENIREGRKTVWFSFASAEKKLDAKYWAQTTKQTIPKPILG